MRKAGPGVSRPDAAAKRMMDVMVTGASSGIGLAISKGLLERGDRVFAHYRTPSSEFFRLKERFKKTGRLKTHRANFEKNSSLNALIRAFDLSGWRLGALVNNAGTVGREALLEEIDHSLWRKVFSVNVEAPLFLSQWAFQEMAKGGGKIVNISSISAKYAGGDTTFHYGVSKATLDAMTVGLARQGVSRKITVNGIRPGVTDTDAHRKYTPNKDMKKRVKQIPMKRMARPEEIASMALFLLSPQADYITGQIISVSGGD